MSPFGSHTIYLGVVRISPETINLLKIPPFNDRKIMLNYSNRYPKEKKQNAVEERKRFIERTNPTLKTGIDNQTKTSKTRSVNGAEMKR